MPHNPDNTVHFQSSFVATPRFDAGIKFSSQFCVPVSFRLYIKNLSKVYPGLEASDILLLYDRIDKMVERNHSDLTDCETPPFSVTVEGLSFDPAYIEQANSASKQLNNALDQYESQGPVRVELDKQSRLKEAPKPSPTFLNRVCTTVTIIYYASQLLMWVLSGDASANVQDCLHYINEIVVFLENELSPNDGS